ncbi:MAG: NUDIX hydrolase [Rubellimicrobium sp.]|nr:NUDIX hydrolase [Rubellimicrobium sp.]
MMRRYGDRPDPARHYRTRPGAYAVLLREGRLLLTLQHDPAPEYQLPGGGIDPGEGQLRALHREVAEETGWSIGAARRIGAFRRFTFMPEYDLWAEKICHVWLARPVLCLGPPAEPGHTALWASPPEALDLIVNEGERGFLRGLFGA